MYIYLHVCLQIVLKFYSIKDADNLKFLSNKNSLPLKLKCKIHLKSKYKLDIFIKSLVLADIYKIYEVQVLTA